MLKVFFGETGTLDDMLATISAIRDEAASGVEHYRQFAELYAAGEGRHPERFALSALVARLLGEQQAATERWARWAEQVVIGVGHPLPSGRRVGSRDDPGDGNVVPVPASGGALCSEAMTAQRRVQSAWKMSDATSVSVFSSTI